MDVSSVSHTCASASKTVHYLSLLSSLFLTHAPLQVRQFLRCRDKLDLKFLDLEERERAERYMELQSDLVDRLPIRLVDQYCRGINSPLSAPFTQRREDRRPHLPGEVFGDASNLQNDGNLREILIASPYKETILSKLGTPFPTGSEAMDIMRGFGPSEFCFWSFDWSGDWESLLEEERINFFEENNIPVPQDISSIFSVSTRARTESEIPVALDECFKEFSKEEVLETERYCSNCKAHRQVKKTMNLWRLPEVLILGLKRYKQGPGIDMWGGGNIQRKKIDNFIDFPLEGLNVRPYLSSRNPLLSGFSPDECTYDLFAVCNHYGRMGFGHYTAVARNWDGDDLSPNWFSYDDDDVRRCTSLSDVKSNAAYVLFYRKKANKNTSSR